jgi:hypothetical protein
MAASGSVSSCCCCYKKKWRNESKSVYIYVCWGEQTFSAAEKNINKSHTHSTHKQLHINLRATADEGGKINSGQENNKNK